MLTFHVDFALLAQDGGLLRVEALRVVGLLALDAGLVLVHLDLDRVLLFLVDHDLRHADRLQALAAVLRLALLRLREVLLQQALSLVVTFVDRALLLAERARPDLVFVRQLRQSGVLREGKRLIYALEKKS